MGINFHFIMRGFGGKFAWLYVPHVINPLIVLRVAFGLLMAISTIRFMLKGWIREFYVLPRFHFTYLGFGWVRPLPEWGLWLVFGGLLILSLWIMLGFFYRPSMALFFVLFTYIELLDKTYYLNHYYFVSLFSFLLIWLPLNGRFSLDVYWGWAQERHTVPAWMVWLVRVQLGLVYFFAGIAKISGDWLLDAMPLKIWLRARTGTPLIGGLFDFVWVAYVMSWAGMLFDTLVPFGLMWPKTGRWAYGVVVVFHLMTAVLFRIGMFPYVMIACTLVFFDWPWLNLFSQGGRSSHAVIDRRCLRWFCLVFLSVQLVLPMRHHLYGGPVNWTEEGYRFAWRVMLVEKTGSAVFDVYDPQTAIAWRVYPRDYLTMAQEKQMAFQPDMILQFAHYLEGEIGRDVEIRAEVYASLNGRSSRLLLDPEVDLTAVPYDWRPRPWILPLDEVD